MVYVRSTASLFFAAYILAPTSAVSQVISQRPCPRVDIIQLGDQFAAINFDGYTLGHVRGPAISDPFLPKRPDARIIAIKPSSIGDPVSPPSPKLPVSPHCPDITISNSNQTLTLGDELIAKFKSFSPTQEIIEKLKQQQQTAGRRIQFDIPRRGEMVAKVRSGPDVPMPDSGGGGGERPVPRDPPKPRTPKNTP